MQSFQLCWCSRSEKAVNNNYLKTLKRKMKKMARKKTNKTRTNLATGNLQGLALANFLVAWFLCILHINLLGFFFFCNKYLYLLFCFFSWMLKSKWAFSKQVTDPLHSHCFFIAPCLRNDSFFLSAINVSEMRLIPHFIFIFSAPWKLFEIQQNYLVPSTDNH